MSEIYKYIQMNPDGFFVLNNEAITDKDYGRQLLESMTMDSRHRPVVTFQGVHAYVEAFDEPLIVQQVEFNNQKWNAICLYDFSANFYLDSLSLDEWDRFHGITEQGVPFVFSRKAQNEFFNLLDEFDDDSITFQEKVYTPPLWPGCNADVEKESFWSQKYSEMDPPGWELGEPAKPLVEVLPQLKLVKSRILVLGCGNGHDAALFAQQGHIVTAIDMSLQALENAKKNYGHLTNLTFIQADALQLNPQFEGQFDVVFEHTFYCAIPPEKRDHLVKIWKSYLTDTGHFLGIFFTWPKPLIGPPFSGSEYEIKRRLDKYFKPLYWTRWKSSLPHRQGTELVVYALVKGNA